MLSGSHHMPQEAHSWLIIDDVILSFTRPGPTDDALWNAFAKDLRNSKVSKYVGAAVGVIDVTSVQRKIVADALRERKLPVAAISDERLVRGMITAVAWLGANIKPFAWSELQQATDYLGIPQETASKVIEAMLKFKASYSR